MLKISEIIALSLSLDVLHIQWLLHVFTLLKSIRMPPLLNSSIVGAFSELMRTSLVLYRTSAFSSEAVPLGKRVFQ